MLASTPTGHVVMTDAKMDASPAIRVIEGGGATFELVADQDEAGFSRAVHQADGLILSSSKRLLSADDLEQMERCRIVVRLGVGVDNIDVEAATRKGVIIANVPDYCAEEVASHAAALLLAGMRKIVTYDRSVRSGEWEWSRGVPIERLSEQMVGVLGFGRIGREFAARVRPFGCRLLVTDPWVGDAQITAFGAEPVSKEELFRTADAVSIHLPLSDATEGLVGRELLRSMKPTALLVNTSRGPIVDEHALVDALQKGRIAAAALDVLVDEPPLEDHPVRRLENVILTPHVAWYSEASLPELVTKAAEEVMRVLAGERPRSQAMVNPSVLA
jgi:D-3-phosphoglycerate dehydrogenase